MRVKNTANRIKRLLLISSLVMILGSVVFMRASYAWFTDTDMQINRVLVGKLKIDLLMDKTMDDGDPADYVSVDNSTGDIFAESPAGADNAIFSAANGNAERWEPGVTRVVYLAVENKGDVPLDYYFKLRVADLGLADALEYAVIDDARFGDLEGVDSWEELLALSKLAKQGTAAVIDHGDLGTLLLGSYDVIQKDYVFDPVLKDYHQNVPIKIIGLSNQATGHLAEPGPLSPSVDYFALAVHMKEDAGNQFQAKSIVFDVAVLGQQVYTTPDQGWFEQ